MYHLPHLNRDQQYKKTKYKEVRNVGHTAYYNVPSMMMKKGIRNGKEYSEKADLFNKSFVPSRFVFSFVFSRNCERIYLVSIKNNAVPIHRGVPRPSILFLSGCWTVLDRGKLYVNLNSTSESLFHVFSRLLIELFCSTHIPTIAIQIFAFYQQRKYKFALFSFARNVLIILSPCKLAFLQSPNFKDVFENEIRCTRSGFSRVQSLRTI